ncbi:MAG: MoaD/ThiS family protein [Candidatus Nanohaloarchaea archaeon]|nr:MoaD/ThiS family protein [Candidatus Nanohaloarchaea archaeon]
MDVTLTIEEEGSGRERQETVEVDADAAVTDALAAAGINPETVLVERDGSIVPRDADLDGLEELRVLEVISGG